MAGEIMGFDKADVEIEMDLVGNGSVKINGKVIPCTTSVHVESTVGALPRVVITILPTSIKYVVPEWQDKPAENPSASW